VFLFMISRMVHCGRGNMAVATAMCSGITLGEFTAIGSVVSVPLHWSKLTLS